MFAANFQVAWNDLDANRHMANYQYLAYAAQTRFLFLAQHGFGPDEFAAHGIGPAVLKDELIYRRELSFLEPFKVSLLSGGQNASGSRFILVNRFTKADGSLSCEVRAMGVWLDLSRRKAVPPPPALAQAMNAAERTEDYVDL